MRAEDKMPRLSKLIEGLGLLERVAVHAIPITVGGQAEGAVGGLAAAAITEKTAGVAGDLVAGDGDVLEDALLDGVVVGIEGCDGEFRQYVVLCVRQGVDVEDREAGGDVAVFGLLRVHAAVACRRAEGRGAARVVELQAGDIRRYFLVSQHEPEHDDSTGQREVVGLLGVGYHEITIIIKGVGHFVAGERHLVGRGDSGRTVTAMGDDHELESASRKRQGYGAEITVRVLLRNCLDLRAVRIKDGDVQAGT